VKTNEPSNDGQNQRKSKSEAQSEKPSETGGVDASRKDRYGRRKMAVGLVHHPVYDRKGSIVATNITNFDIHDIARACRVFDVERYFIVHPMREQQMFVSRVLDHWRTGSGSKFNPMRKTALTMVEPVESVDAALKAWGRPATVVATSAKDTMCIPQVTFQELRDMREEEDVFLLFGTGWGLSEDVLHKCQYVVDPIRGAGHEDYRHLSVRSAVSIILDRLAGSW